LPHFYINPDDGPFGPKHAACSKEGIVLTFWSFSSFFTYHQG